MASERASHRFQVNQDLKHEVREWKAEKIGWVTIAMAVCAALAGLLGPGPLSSATAGDPASGFWVEYEKFERYQAPSRLVIHMMPSSREQRLWVNQQFMRKVDLQHIDPMPERSEAGTDRYIYPLVFSDAKSENIVTIYFEPNEFGLVDTEIGLEDGPSTSFSQLIYP